MATDPTTDLDGFVHESPFAELLDMRVSDPDDGSSVVVMGKQLRETPVPPSVRARGQDIPEAIESVIMRAIRKSPSTRFSHAQEMKKALEDALLAPEKRRTRARRIAALVTASACAVRSVTGNGA